MRKIISTFGKAHSMMMMMMTMLSSQVVKSPLLVSYLFSIGDPRHPSPLCPLCLMHDHTSSHLFECKSLPTSLSSLDLWTNPDKVEPFLATWGERLLAATWFGCWTLLAARWWSGVDNNNNNNNDVVFNHYIFNLFEVPLAAWSLSTKLIA